ncbi:MAG TPA: single-stranded-DNA-specific exonuclease RecJ [Burkholderiaceae bacterium]|nr:single-stranded-DNA-specific exonuclease RecJ [Burkholderiaceae bacterium]
MTVRFHTREFDPGAAHRLQLLGVLPPLARALAARGILNEAQLNLSVREILPPGSMSHSAQAASLLADAIEQRRRLLVIADYDCDGATACAVAIRGLRSMGAVVDYLVPNRFEYGYGLTPELVELAAQRRPDLLVTVDNGIASVEGVERANALGIDVLITDHHLPVSRLPNARAIVNPNQPDCSFASKHLAGVGVMFYVLLQLRAELRRRGRFDENTQPRLDTLLDLVAAGTVADLVRLDRNNRILVSGGLERIRRGSMQAGVAALFRIAGRDYRRARASDLGFALGPRINAAGRLADMTQGIECLLTDDPERALELAQRLDSLNRERRQIEENMQATAQSDLKTADLQGSSLAQRRTIAIYRDDWHPGVVGLIAARIKDRYHRPTIAFARADANWLRGSGRSIEGVHLRDTLDRVSKLAPGLVARFGGHAMAAGLTIAHGALEEFTRVFEQAAYETVDPALYARTLAVDGTLEASEITHSLVEAINDIVWGQGFAEPLFDNEFDVLEQRIVKGRHLQLTLALHGRRWPAIWFGRVDTVPDRARLAYRPVIDEFRGQRRLSLRVEQVSS